MSQQASADGELNAVIAAIRSEPMLNQAVVDIQRYEDTLAVFTSQDTPESLVRMVLKNVWSGPIEVHCTTSLVAGSDTDFT